VPEMESKPLVRVRNLHKVFRHGETDVVALDDIYLDVSAGEFLALMGPSGSTLSRASISPPTANAKSSDTTCAPYPKATWPAGAISTSVSCSNPST
jgi:ABC-type hemin transport system ATPase subunit